MRQLMIRVPRGCGADALDAARRHQGSNLALWEASSGGEPVDLLLVHVSNAQVDPLLDELQRVPGLHVSLFPSGVIALRPPAEEAPGQVVDVAPRSPVEVFLSGLQGVGSWKAFAGYAAAAGFVVWIGLFTNTVYLLTAAMLIAPFAGPAMNAALATSRGDGVLLGRSLLRYAGGLAICIAVAFFLSLVLRQEIATEQMVEASLVSSVAFLLPVVAGAAGALNVCQSDRSSLVSGAATGMLVAASLAPPAGLVGMASAIGEWDMVKAGCFVLVLQIAGINLSGAVVFRLFGLKPRGVRYQRGKAWTGVAAWAGSAIALAALLAMQLSTSPSLQQSTREQRAAALVRGVVADSRMARLVEARPRFTRADVPGPPTLLVEVYVQPAAGVAAAQVRQSLPEAIRAGLAAEFNVRPLVDLTVLEGRPGE